MSRESIKYLRLLQSLLPGGKAWNKYDDSSLTEFLYGEAEEFARVDTRVDDLGTERDTRTTDELLTDHEIDFGIPNDCFNLNTTNRLRRQAIYSQLLTTGRQDKQYFIDIAAALGYTVTITEYVPCLCGLAYAGDPCGGYRVLSYWKVSIQYPDVAAGPYAKAFNIAFDSIYSADIEALYCIIRSLRPAHSTVIFDFIGPDFDVSFDESFDALPSYTDSYLYGDFNLSFGDGFDVNHGGDFDFNAFAVDFKKSAYGTAGTNPGAFGYGFKRDSFDWYRIWI